MYTLKGVDEQVMVLTNNPLVYQHLKTQSQHHAVYHDVSLPDLLIITRDRVHQGHKLLTHPLSGSVKPNETPYKSISITEKPGASLCLDSLMIIEQAIGMCRQMPVLNLPITKQMHQDFRLVDLTLISSALENGVGSIIEGKYDLLKPTHDQRRDPA